MCGRYALRTPWQRLADNFGLRVTNLSELFSLQRRPDTTSAHGPPEPGLLPINSLRTSVRSGSTSIGLRR